ncbi:hypothetical protein BGZ65_002090 [Modicella reniformis]|uniref:Methyltransferase type 11 domain-containing protein n=1 Tax=Modicella reniformis TaxID=1440133 RepID=A0A9P6SN70_9FUNG|nr:hypothetical protein BGZ65_002090 [Modicella reniformis]
MATFSSKTFNSALYLSFRPGYNADFYKMLYDYHMRNNGQFDTAVDVGTGTGQVACVLAEKFKHVHGVDASAIMLASAVQKPNIKYHVSNGEDLNMIPSSSVDVLTVAQALHWFDHPRLFSEVKRVLKPHGTFAAVGYSFVMLENHPRASKRVYCLGNEPDQLGTFWDNGRLIVQNLYRSIEVPLKNVERHYFPDESGSELPLMMENVTMNHFRNHIKTWSSYKNYSEKHPDRPDIVDKTVDAILEEENLKEEDEVTLIWPTVLILAENNA